MALRSMDFSAPVVLTLTARQLRTGWRRPQVDDNQLELFSPVIVAQLVHCKSCQSTSPYILLIYVIIIQKGGAQLPSKGEHGLIRRRLGKGGVSS